MPDAPPGAPADHHRADATQRITRAVARGDPAALAELYEAWFNRLYAAAQRLTRRDESFCLDVVQDAMLRIVRSIKPMDREEDLARWMNRVVHTAALDTLRRDARRAAREARAAPAPRAADSAAAAADHEQIAWLRAQLADLAPADQALLAARFARDRTLSAAGLTEGLTDDAAHGRIRRAIAKLRSTARGIFHDT